MAKDPILGLVEYPESHFDPFERKEFILKLIPAPMTGKIVKSEFFGNKTRFDLLQQVKSRIEENLRDKDPPPLSPDLVEKAVTTIFGEDSKIFKVFSEGSPLKTNFNALKISISLFLSEISGNSAAIPDSACRSFNAALMSPFALTDILVRFLSSIEEFSFFKTSIKISFMIL